MLQSVIIQLISNFVLIWQVKLLKLLNINFLLVPDWVSQRQQWTMKITLNKKNNIRWMNAD